MDTLSIQTRLVMWVVSHALWTAPHPAKSIMPDPNRGMPPVALPAASHPAPLHCQWATMGYTNAMRKEEY